MTERRYTLAELNARLASRHERIEAAYATAMLVHHRRILDLLSQRAQPLPDGRIALTTADILDVMARVGDATKVSLLAAIGSAVFTENDQD